MKRLIFTGLAGLAMLSVASGRTDPAYVNNVVQIFNASPPPQIDATNFINNSAFINDFVGGIPSETANTLYYTNFGVIGAYSGWRFDTFNTDAVTPFYSAASTLFNQPGAIINCGGTNNGAYGNAFQDFGTICLINATNIINRGTIEVGPNGLMSIQGDNVNLFGGLLDMEGFENGDLTGKAGMFDSYWGVGLTPIYNPVSYFTPIGASSPYVWVTNRSYISFQQAISAASSSFATTVTNALTTISNDGTNAEYGVDVSYFVVFLGNGDDVNIKHNVYFPGQTSIVEWAWPSTNIITGLPQTNHLILVDAMRNVTNLMLVPNGVGPASTAFGPTYIPTNYSLFRGSKPTQTPANKPLPPGWIAPDTNNFTSAYSAYEAIFDPTTVILGEVAGMTYTNMPGRIEVNANNQLDLSSSRIAGLNYLQLASSNHTKMDANTRILASVADFNLVVTNSTLTFSNLLAPTCPRLNGFLDLFTACWTNIPAPVTNLNAATGGTNIFDYTNNYYVTLVSTFLSSASVSQVRNLNLHATNVVLSDVFNIIEGLNIDAHNLTITTNGRGGQTLAGQLNVPAGIPLGASTFPHLQTLTNYGTIDATDTAAFGAPSAPLAAFVNGGTLFADGISIWATNFQDTGLIDAGSGALSIFANSAVLSNGVLNATANNLVLISGDLSVSHQKLNAGRSLTIQATSSLSDGGTTSSNFWNVGLLGFSLPIEPPIASLLGTTITDTAPAFDYFVPCQWAGRDLGPVAAGFTNNAALGRLILDGASPSSFEFLTTSGNNAIYVDYLEFRNYMTNFDANTNLANLIVDPGMKIYYAQLIINGVSYAQALNQKNGGALNWVPSYAGAFSSIPVVYPDGTTHYLNKALAMSTTLDSNGNGIPNASDLTSGVVPVFTPWDIKPTITLTNLPPQSLLLTWHSMPYATNSVFFTPSLTPASWQLVTNFVSGPALGQQQAFDSVRTGGYYRVRVDVPGF